MRHSTDRVDNLQTHRGNSLFHRLGIKLRVERGTVHENVEPSKRGQYFSTSALTAVRVVMSVGTARAWYPLFVRISATACEAEAFRSTTATAAPASARVLQNSAPSSPSTRHNSHPPLRSNFSWIVIISFMASLYRLNRPLIYGPDIVLRLTKPRLPADTSPPSKMASTALPLLISFCIRSIPSSKPARTCAVAESNRSGKT